MSAGPFVLFAANIADLNMSDLLAASVHLALVDYNAGNPIDSSSAGDTLWSDLSADEIAAGDGYSAGGIALSNVTATPITDGFQCSSDTVEFTATGTGIASWRYAVLFVNGTLWGKSSPLIGYFLGNSADADIPLTPGGGPLQLFCPVDGWFRQTRA